MSYWIDSSLLHYSDPETESLDNFPDHESEPGLGIEVDCIPMRDVEEEGQLKLEEHKFHGTADF